MLFTSQYVDFGQYDLHPCIKCKKFSALLKHLGPQNSLLKELLNQRFATYNYWETEEKDKKKKKLNSSLSFIGLDNLKHFA